MNSLREQPIALFDSGIGGLTVLKHVRVLLPGEDLIYLADSAHTPYGDKSERFIIDRSLEIGQFFIDKGAKAIVIACNSATAAAVDVMRQEFDIPIIGMEPGIKPAVSQSKSRRVGILATSATVASKKFAALVECFHDEVEISIQACPGLVEQVEKMALKSEETYQLLSSYLLPLQEKGVDTVTLGCTHYPFLLSQIREIIGEATQIIDTGPAVAEQLKRVLHQSAALREQSDGGAVQFYATHLRSDLSGQISELWGEKVALKQVPYQESKSA